MAGMSLLRVDIFRLNEITDDPENYKSDQIKRILEDRKPCTLILKFPQSGETAEVELRVPLPVQLHNTQSYVLFFSILFLMISVVKSFHTRNKSVPEHMEALI